MKIFSHVYAFMSEHRK